MHDYIERNILKKIRYIKVENIHSPKGESLHCPICGYLVKVMVNVPVIRKILLLNGIKGDARDSNLGEAKMPMVISYSSAIVRIISIRVLWVKDGDKRIDIHILIPGQKYYYRVDVWRNENE